MPRANQSVNISINGVPNLPLPENAARFHTSVVEPRRRTPGLESDPWRFAGRIEDLALNDAASKGLAPTDLVDVTIQFAQRNATHNVAPPIQPLHRPAGAAVTSHSLKRFDATSITTGGAPLPVAIRNPLAHTFSIDLTPIRVHTGAYAQKIVRTLSTRAFAYGKDIFLGSGEQPTDLSLMAHEVAHVVQQSHGATLQHFTVGSGDACEAEAQQASTAALRGDSFTVQQQATPRPQGYGLGDLAGDIGIDIPDPLDWLANKANTTIPTFRMFTIVLGVNPINMTSVDRSPANILRALIEVMPGGGLITQALDNAGVFEKAGAFVAAQIDSLGLVGSSIKAAVTAFIAGLSLTRIVTEPSNVWEDAKRIFTEPIDRIISFAEGLVTGIIELIKDAILKPIAKLAEGTAGYDLLKGILGKDPITNEKVTPSAETLLGPLLTMIGLGDVWQKMQEANAVPRAWAWFQSTMSQLRSFVSQIPDLFIAAFKALTIEDIILVPQAFAKLTSIFGAFMGEFVSWGLDAMFKLLEIVFDVVNPDAFVYVKKTGAALKSILQNPLPFVGNLAKAAKLGFNNFGGNFLTHLKKGLIDWLTGSLTGVYIPKALTLIEFGKLALSVLGITWAQIRGKIVKALGPGGETIMRGLEELFSVVKTLATGSPEAAWAEIKDKLTGLKDTIVSGITNMVVEAVVTIAIPKFVAMFIPGAGFISAIFSIYGMIQVFFQKIKAIIQVANAFVSSIVAIATGNIGAAASKVESILGGVLSLAISFLAGFAGLGKVASKVMGIVNKVRATVDKALDTAINFIITKAKKLFGYLFSGKKDAKAPKKPEGPGKAQRPRIAVSFAMGPSGHQLILDPQGAGEPKVEMASGGLGLFEKKQRDAYNGIEYFKQYMTSITEAQVRREYETKLKPLIDGFQTPNVDAFKAVYKAKFPGKHDGPAISDAEAKSRAEVVAKEAEALLAKLKGWGATSGIPDLAKDAVVKTLQEKGQGVWKEAWEKRKKQVEAAIASVTYNGVKLDYRGSLKKGFRGEQKNMTRFNPSDFDVDLYVVHPADFDAAVRAGAEPIGGQIFPNNRFAPAALGTTSTAAAAALRAALPDVARIGTSNVTLRREGKA